MNKKTTDLIHLLCFLSDQKSLMKKMDSNICVKIERFPSPLQTTLAQNETIEQPNTLNGISRKKNRRKTSNSFTLSRPLIRRNTARSSLPSFSTSTPSRISKVDLLYMKSLNRLPNLRVAPSSNTLGLKTPGNSKSDGYLAKSTEVCRMSYPCCHGCAACAFSHCFGPVKVFFSQFSEPKECFVREIRDGQGRAVIPRSRRKELRGLVYDKQTHSLYPPAPRGFRSPHVQINSTRKIFY